MSLTELESLLPHRKPMLLLDEVDLKEDETGQKTAYGAKTIEPEAYYVQGHFPEQPIVPGVILCEILAQTSCVLLQGTIHNGTLPLLTAIEKAKFRQSVCPGDTFQTEVKLVKQKGPFYLMTGKGYVKGKLCVTADFSFMLVDQKTMIKN